MSSTDLFQFIEKMGLPTSVIIIAVILFLLFKLNIPTLFSASFVELKLFTKEQRIANYIFTFIYLDLLMACLTSMLVVFWVKIDLFTTKSSQNVSIIMYFLSILHICIAFIIKEVPEAGWLKKKIAFRITNIVFFLLTFPYISIQLVSTLADEIHKNGMSITLLMVIYLLAVVFTPIYLIYFIFINKISTSNKVLYIELPITKTSTISVPNLSTSQYEKWYLIHPINRDYFLLADAPNVNTASKVKLIPKNDLSQFVVKIDGE